MAGANNSLHGYDGRLGDDDDDAKPTLKGEELEEEETSQSPSRKKQKRNKPTLRYLYAAEFDIFANNPLQLSGMCGTEDEMRSRQAWMSCLREAAE